VDRHRLSSLRRMSRQRPGDARVRFGLAVELLNAGEFQEGVDALRGYLEMEPQDGSAWGRLGAALADLGQMDAAVHAYERGLEAAREKGHGGLIDEMENALEELE
jgi:Flp pilus assembly protein TadD